MGEGDARFALLLEGWMCEAVLIWVVPEAVWSMSEVGEMRDVLKGKIESLGGGGEGLGGKKGFLECVPWVAPEHSATGYVEKIAEAFAHRVAVNDKKVLAIQKSLQEQWEEVKIMTRAMVERKLGKIDEQLKCQIEVLEKETVEKQKKAIEVLVVYLQALSRKIIVDFLEHLLCE